MNQSINWSSLESSLTTLLCDYANERYLNYRGPKQSILTVDKDGASCTHCGLRSDGLLVDKEKLFALEVEAGQTHPDTNVGKYWQIQEKHPFQQIILFHVYTPMINSYGGRMALADFYAEKMSNDFNFIYIKQDRRNHDLSEYDAVLNEIWGDICSTLKLFLHHR